MAFIRFSEGSAMFDVTPVDNMFLLEYLPIAPEEFLRVYLYVRMLCLHPELGGGLEEIARALRMDEEVVQNAFLYWEREGLVQRMSDRPPTYVLLPMRSVNLATPMERDYYEFREFNANLQSLFGSENLLHPHEFKLANDWLTVLGYTQEAALRLVEYELSKSKSRKRNVSSAFRRLDKLAVSWAERGIHTLPDVERAIAHDEGVYQAALAVVHQFSLRRQPTADEISFAQKWLHEWHFSQEDIIAACAETVKTANPSFAYLDAILKNRRSGPEPAREDLKRVLAELGVRSPITPAWQKSYQAMLEQGFDPRTIEMAAVQVAAKNRHRFEDLEWMVGRWHELGLHTPQAAESYIQKNRALSQQLRELLATCGTDRRPTLGDLALLESWKSLFPDEIIAFAAECARGKKDPLAYMDKVIGQWKKAGVKTLEDARARNTLALSALAESRSGSAPSSPAVPAALNYAQRKYTDDDFGDDFFFDVVKEYGGADT